MASPDGATADLGPLSEDGLLDRAVLLRQPEAGYRAGSDAVLLAAAVPARPGDHVLDVGAGVGAVSLCLARRCPGVVVTGLEREAALVALGNDNAARNGLAGQVSLTVGDLRRAPEAIRGTAFDHVASNPPFYEAGRNTASPNAFKARAHGESEVPLADWVRFCVRRTRPGGTVTLIHRASRLPELLAALTEGAGDIVVFPLWPRAGQEAKRVIVQGRAQRRGPARLHPGLVMHGPSGGDTAEARSILRGGGALSLDGN